MQKISINIMRTLSSLTVHEMAISKFYSSSRVAISEFKSSTVAICLYQFTKWLYIKSYPIKCWHGE